jgi:hypothetical protein
MVTTIEAKKGYWVYCPYSRGASLDVYGSMVGGTVKLGQGWNVVGFTANKAVPVEDQATNRPYQTVSFDGNQYQAVTSVVKGKAYWIYATSPAEIPAGN